MDEAMKAFVFTISGMLVGAIPSIVIAIISKRSEERRHFREIVTKTAIENWRGAIDVMKLKKRGRLAPLDIFLVNTLALFSRIDFRKIKPEDIKPLLENVHAITQEAIDWAENRDGSTESQ